jgi:molecular chaperone DnaK
MTLTKAKFEQLIKPIVDKLISCAKKAVELAKIEYKDLNGILLIGGSCRIPLVQEELTKEFGVTLLKSSNMDLAVAEGAAIQANNIVGGDGSTDILLVDVCPISLGIETLGGVMTKLIDANTTIPCKKEEVFSTAETNQTVVTVHVLQGERPMARDNKSLGKFNLEGILPAMRGVPKIVVSFDLDVNGILSVTAKDQATGKEQSIRIEGSGKLSDDEINRIKAEAEKYAEKDKELKEEAEAVNKGDSLIFAQEKLIKDQEGNLTQEEKSTLEGLVNDMKQAVKERDVKKINELEDSINKKWQDVSQRIYSNSQKQDTTTEAETPNNDGIQDADFEEVK